MVVLGISLGTRLSGIAVLDSGRLVTFGTHSFKQSWSEEKAAEIAGVYERYVADHGVNAIVVKVPPMSHLTDTLRSLLERMNDFVAAHGCMVQVKTHRDIKAELPDILNKRDLMLHAVAVYPELSDIRSRELAGRNKYHTKMFEAVIVAHLGQINHGKKTNE